MNRHILTSPIFRWMLGLVEHTVQEEGFFIAAQNTMKRSRTATVVKGKTTELKDVLRNRPVVVVANHPTSPAVIALISALEDRPDFRSYYKQ